MYIDLFALSCLICVYMVISMIIDKDWESLGYLFGIVLIALGFIFGSEQLAGHFGNWSVVVFLLCLWLFIDRLIAKKNKKELRSEIKKDAKPIPTQKPETQKRILSGLDQEDVNFYMQEYGMTEEDALKALKKQRECGF